MHERTLQEGRRILQKETKGTKGVLQKEMKGTKGIGNGRLAL
jgi:hypothetical protein